MEKLKGGLGDNMTIGDFAKKYGVSNDIIIKHLKKGIKVEKEHTNNPKIAREITIDHLFEDLYYYDKLEKVEAKEQTMSGSSGAFVAPMGASTVKRPIGKIHNSKSEEFTEATTSSVSAAGQYDAPFGTGSKNPLKIDGEKSIKSSKAVKDPKFPMWVKGGQYVEIKKECKLSGKKDGTSAQCNQGDINNLILTKPKKLNENKEYLRKVIQEVSKEYGLPMKEVEKIVLKEI